MAATYALTLMLDINMPTCLTSRNKATEARFGYQIDYAAIGLPAHLADTLNAMRAEYGTHFDYEEDRYTTVEQEQAYSAKLEALVPEIEAALGPDYEIVAE